MKRFVLVLAALLFSVAFAAEQCEDFLDNAKSFPQETYPWYFGAGQEYMGAAQCYETQNNVQLANQYYNTAAVYFIDATGFLSEVGDYPLKGTAYEWAADAYLKVGNTAGAEEYYNKAMHEYDLGNCTGEIAALNAKLNPAASYDYLLLMGIAVLLIIFVIAVLAVRRKRRFFEEPVEWPKPSQSSHNPRTSGTYGRAQPQPPSPPRPPTPTVLSPREKMRRRIREKYKLE